MAIFATKRLQKPKTEAKKGYKTISATNIQKL